MRMDGGQALCGGSLVIKARFGDEVRKAAIQNVSLTRDELLLMLDRWFGGRLSTTEPALLRYKDEDGDLITIADDSDLAFAAATQTGEGGGCLKIVVSLPSQPLQAPEIRSQLAEIRDVASRLLDALDAKPLMSNGHEPIPPPQPQAPVSVKKEPSPAAVKEFDPLEPPRAPSLPPSAPETPAAAAAAPPLPPPVYGVGGEVVAEPPRSETPLSQRSSVANAPPSLDSSINAPPQPQENIATITPTIHEQVSVAGGGPTAPVALNGAAPPPTGNLYAPPPMAQPPIHSAPAASAPPPLPAVPPVSAYQPPPPVTYAPAPPAPPTSHPQPPTAAASMPPSMPPHSYPQAQVSAPPPTQTGAPFAGYPPTPAVSAPPPPTMAPPPMQQTHPGGAPPPMGPPPSMPPVAGGANPFARAGNPGGNPYARAFPPTGYPAPPQH